ncbi:hypothetical protein VF14_24580 [Nostoc linckia z18]|uniref:Uncharacterized protein n=2 Tax=Nostoc linckia TaxID=92942 RepID=A0A9Q6EJ63_NOSLI|nr:hypothetical protein VF02_30305 [Nostoc linckia z1]PHJ59999.1 hypothetical protein VF05_31110 [Nostoc linckia z3]PHJ64861.1 hypothetical protein VF03_28355 [Nostoc linckia z2]PHJ80286.1 hypothetical protein VF07_32405 [Nostoc linckia z6]PHJ81752.1 hypothetical protein VF06_19085 [Nostoc linckia z4]PHJ93323.1 hypothetical protein VF04_26235 [Nostoc linckia z7]PHJ97943.1 hypothetical protein VF08_27685 [Nostoc linckia z8]PHK07986.1 hypothetical protein VF09_21865 [Nostoc linckia z9]PHK1628
MIKISWCPRVIPIILLAKVFFVLFWEKGIMLMVRQAHQPEKGKIANLSPFPLPLIPRGGPPFLFSQLLQEV